MTDEIENPVSDAATKPKRWSKIFDCCKACGATVIAHAGKGFCRNCYNLQIENKHKSHERIRGVAAKIITKEFLKKEYIDNKKSLTDIAIICNCTRQFIFKKMREFSIESRNLSSSRRLAISGKKLKYEKISESGQVEIFLQERHSVNETFFSGWSIEMAYVLGIICTDGNLGRDAPIIKIDQKETELLEKVKVLMDSDAKLVHQARREYGKIVSGELYSLRFCSKLLYDDLLGLGLTSSKSLNMQFPNVPNKFKRHFIRGCWDGDGSVFIDKRFNQIRASFVCGSLDFLKMMTDELLKAGLKARKIYESHAINTSYMIRYTGAECEKLYCFLYHKVSPELYLLRKHDIFYDRFGKAGKKTWILNPDYL